MIGTDIKLRPVSYANQLEPRRHSSIDLVVIHCTELPDLATARVIGERIHYQDSGTGNCGHFYIERNGDIEQWVPTERVAHHVRGYNERSIGIELVNLGRYPDWFDSRQQEMTEPYQESQLESLIALIRDFRETLPSLEWISGHQSLDRETVPASDDSDIRVFRKQDPGPLFPWGDVLPSIELDLFEPAAA